MALPVIRSGITSDAEKLEITFSPNGNPRLTDVGASFTALERLYERQMGEGAELHVADIRSGSIITLLEPVRTMMGVAMPMIGQINDAVDFGKTLVGLIRAYSYKLPGAPKNDAQEIREILRPVVSNGGGKLRIKSYHYSDAARSVDVEFANDDLQTAFENASANVVGLPALGAPSAEGQLNQRWFTEETLIFDQASRAPGKESGRTGDRGTIVSFSPKPLPVYFKKSITGIKERMVLSSDNPMLFVFVVDGLVSFLGDQAISYMITHVHSAQPID